MRDDTALVEAMARLAVAATGDFAVDDMLRQLSEAAAGALPVDGYTTPAARLVLNAIRRFMDPAPFPGFE